MKVVNNLLSKLFQKTGQAAEERIEADRVLPRSGSGVRLLNNKLLFIPISVLDNIGKTIVKIIVFLKLLSSFLS